MMRGASFTVGVLVLALSACAGQQERAQSPRSPAAQSAAATAKTDSAAHLEDGLRLYAEARYTEAAAAFERAYQKGGSSPALFAEGQSLQKAGDCAAALEVYERLLEVEPDPTYANAVREMMAQCK